ncbi:MAG: ABC transporter substrate-binding protein [Hormoscilla sp. GUM202]|nr:ABC transporter substrate-binding protein [Hormoscilla sp. GUM202]
MTNYQLSINRRTLLGIGAIALGSGLLTACSNGKEKTEDGLDRVEYTTDWYAQAEHGGFYQAVATGIYREHGLDATIKMGGPQVNGTQLLMGGVVDFMMGSGDGAIMAVAEGIPKITVAAIFQKHPRVLIAHPGVGNESLELLKGKPIFVSAGPVGYWSFLQAKYGFTEDQRRPYNFNVSPFLLDKNAVQQGYFSSEPFTVQQAGVEPVIFLLADYGYNPYATTIDTQIELVEKKPELVQRFVDGSIKGWYSYLENPAPGNELIKKDYPQMTDKLLAYGFTKMKEYGMVDSGDAKTLGIGAMTEERWQSFFDIMVEAGLLKPDTNYKKAYTLEFVNKGVKYYL